MIDKILIITNEQGEKKGYKREMLGNFIPITQVTEYINNIIII